MSWSSFMSFPTRCLAVNERDLESSTSDVSSIDDMVITETKRNASSIHKGMDLVAFYSDHHSLPAFQGLDKYVLLCSLYIFWCQHLHCIICHEINRIVKIALLASSKYISYQKSAAAPAMCYRCQATRLLLESDDAASQNLLTTLPSPLAFPQELCLVYDEWYL